MELTDMSEDQIRQELLAMRGEINGNINSLRGEVLEVFKTGCAHYPEHATLAAHVRQLDKAVSESRTRPIAQRTIKEAVIEIALKPWPWIAVSVISFSQYAPAIAKTITEAVAK